MRSQPIEVRSGGRLTRSRQALRRGAKRAESLRVLTLEDLESRTLMAVLPATVTTPNVVDISGQPTQTSNESTPSIVIDPNDSQKLVAVWTRNDPTFPSPITELVFAATSIDGGQTWNGLNVDGQIHDPPTLNPALPYPQASNASVAFDRNDNFYVLYEQHETGDAWGDMLLDKFSFAANTVSSTFFNHDVYGWGPGSSQAFEPTLAVDSNLASFSDVDSNGVTRTQNDLNTGNVYIAYAMNAVPPAGNPAGTQFNPNVVFLYTSIDGGQTFSTPELVNNNEYTRVGSGVSPSIVVSQGSAPRAAGTNGPDDPGSTGVLPGEVSVIYEDYDTGATASPPFTQILQNRLLGVNQAISTDASAGPILPGSTASPSVPMTTNFPIQVAISTTTPFVVSDASLTLALFDTNLATLSAELIPPPASGLSPITLFEHMTDPGGTDMFVGISGTNLGLTPGFEPYGTTFTDNADRNITDINPFTGGRGATAPYLGLFQPEFGAFSAYKGAVAGAPNTPNSINGTWTIRFVDFEHDVASAPTPPNQLVVGKLTFNSGFQLGVDTVIATTTVNAVPPALIPIYPTKSAAIGQGIGPDATIASDNTLGAFSPFEGRLYVSYVDRSTVLVANPADNTDIMLTFSDDGGLTWSFPQRVNDDVADSDGFSEGATLPGQTSTTGTVLGGAPFSGRAQFEPSVAVDPATGTLVLSWYDGRNDASRARVATYMTTSIDGGDTFSPDVYANPSQTATDGITGATVNLGPIPDNESSGNPKTEGAVGYGQHQGLAVFGGKIHVIWSSNKNGGVPAPANNTLDIRTATESFADGPRVIASTMGPVGNAGDQVNPDRGADGTPTAEAFQVTFDRWVDPGTFQPNDVKVLFHDATVANLTGGFVPVTSVVPLNLGPLGATTFQVNFAPRNGVGTYSYSIAPTVSDRIRSTKVVVTATGPATSFVSTNVPVTIQPASVQSSIVTVSSFAASSLVQNVTVNLSIMAPDDSGLTITLISPDGTPVTLASGEAFAGGSNYTNTTFSDSASTPIGQGTAPFTGTFQPIGLLSQFIGQVADGTWTLQVQNSGVPLAAKLLNWSITVTPGQNVTSRVSGNLMDQNANGTAGQASDFYAAPQPLSPRSTTPFQGPFSQDTLPLILPGPTVVSSTPTGVPATSDNLVVNGTVSSINVVFDRNMDPSTITTASILQMTGPLGPITGPFTIKANPSGSDPDPRHPQTYQIGFPTQTLSGTYTLSLASTITDENGNALDTNQNVAVDLLRGTPSSTSTPVTYNYSGPSVAIPSTQTVTVPLTVPDNFTRRGSPSSSASPTTSTPTSRSP